jgi:serine/threonine protein kinase
MKNDAARKTGSPAAGLVGANVSLSTLSPQPLSIPDHELIRVIGRGAYGEVWLARHARLGTLRAVKIVRRDQFDDARPFQREFDGIRRYEPISRSHPHLIPILHVGGTDDCFFYVMELADDAAVAAGVPPAVEGGVSPPGELRPDSTGSSHPTPVPPGGTPGSTAGEDARRYIPKTLRSELKCHGPLPIDRCLEIALALAGALAHLHARGLLHRDVKPSNVIFVGGVAKLADIGLVAEVSEAKSLVGTVGYIPPEGPGSAQADLYSLGKVLYELVTGKDRQDFPALPSEFRERRDAAQLTEFNEILLKACESDPRHRYTSAQAVHGDLALLQRGQSVIRKHTRAHWLKVAWQAAPTRVPSANSSACALCWPGA